MVEMMGLSVTYFKCANPQIKGWTLDLIFVNLTEKADPLIFVNPIQSACRKTDLGVKVRFLFFGKSFK